MASSVDGAPTGYAGVLILYRPRGAEELCRVYESRLRAFPPRLPEQPIFYPVLNFVHAERIARDQNTKSRTLRDTLSEKRGRVVEYLLQDSAYNIS